MDWRQLNNELGNIDLYWLDFILKGYLPEDAKVLDAGCGEGRNLTYCLKNEMDVFGIDQNAEAINFLKLIAKRYHLQDLEARFQIMSLNKILFPDATFNVIICSAVLHFASSSDHFNSMVKEMIRVLSAKGKIFIRTMTKRYLPENNTELGHNLYQFTNEQIRYVIDADDLTRMMKSEGLQLIEPYKEVVVENRHCMGTFMFQVQ